MKFNRKESVKIARAKFTVVLFSEVSRGERHPSPAQSVLLMHTHVQMQEMHAQVRLVPMSAQLMM